MEVPKVQKIVLNVGLGEAIQNIKLLDAAQKELSAITGQKAVITKAKKSIASFKLRQGVPIGCKVTLRGKEAEEFIKRAFWVKENRVAEYSFDPEGNFSFGVSDYTDIEGMKYSPEIGVVGMDVCVTLARPGKRVSIRKKQRNAVSKRQRLTRQEGIEFVKNKFKVEVISF